MNKNKKLNTIILLAALVVVIIGAKLLYDNLQGKVQANNLVAQNSNSESSQNENSGSTGDEASKEDLTKAPDITFEDYDGNTIKLSELINKPTVINFWASWCGPCTSEMPHFEEVYKEYKDEINFIMLNMTDGARETKEKAKKFIDGGKYTFPVYYDTKQNGAMTYGIVALPTTLFLDKDGYMVAVGQSALDKETLMKGIDMIYNKEQNELDEGVSAENTANVDEGVKNPSWCTVEPEYIRLSVDEAKNIFSEVDGTKDYYILDVRTQDEYDTEHAENSILIPDYEIREKVESSIPDKKSIVFVYCRGGNRSKTASQIMVDMGYNHVYDIGGLKEAGEVFKMVQ